MRLLPRRLPTLTFVIGASLGCLLARYLSPCSDGTASQQSSIRARAIVRKSGARLCGAVVLPQRQLDTTARAVWETWGAEMAAFTILVGGQSPSLETLGRLPVTALQEVPDFESYSASLRQTFAALIYLHDNYVDRYDWFLLADNRTFVNVRELEGRLQDSDPRGVAYWGEPEELVEGASQHLCAGSPGVIMSAPALKAVVPRLKDCADQLASGEGGPNRAQRGDWGLGFCFSRVIGVSCTIPFKHFHHHHQEDLQFTNKPQLKMEGVATFLAVTTESHYILHHIAKQEQLEALKEEVNSLETDIASLHAKLAPLEVTSASPNTPHRPPSSTQGSPVQVMATEEWPTSLQDESRPPPLSEGSSAQVQQDVSAVAVLPQSKFDVNTWSVIVGAYIHSDQRTDPLLRVPNDVDYEVQQFVSKAIVMVNEEERASYKLRGVSNVFLRYSPVHGRQCIMDLTLVDEPTGKVLKKRMNLASPIQSVPLRVREDPNYKQVVNVVVPLDNVGERFSAFFEDFQREFLRRRVGVRLILVVYGKGEYDRIHSIVTSSRQWPPSRLLIVQGEEGAEFTRGRALHLGLSQLGDSDLVFLCDTDMVMTREFMERCRVNPVQGRRVYYPIFFSYYNMDYAYHREAKPERPVISRRNGHWVSYSYGMVCLFKSDYTATGGFNLSITGWGGEDTDFFTRVLDAKLEVLKAPDPGLAHRWHPKHCSPSLTPSQYVDCLGTRNEVLADKKQLASYIMYLEERLGVSPASLEVDSSSTHEPSHVT